MVATKTRTEHDLIGNLEVPADAYYGVQTARALENFQISGVPISLYPNFIKALAMVKLAAARANADVGHAPREILKASKAPAGKSSTASCTTSSARRVPGRRRHLDQHERERGDRQPRPRAHGHRRASTSTATRTTT
jgi:hypothetical protein